jgi:hypothetical protein
MWMWGQVRRILYLDNDVVVSCCLEEVYWAADLHKPDKVPAASPSCSYSYSCPSSTHHGAPFLSLSLSMPDAAARPATAPLAAASNTAAANAVLRCRWWACFRSPSFHVTCVSPFRYALCTTHGHYLRVVPSPAAVTGAVLRCRWWASRWTTCSGPP